MSDELAVYEQKPLSAVDLKSQVNLIQDVMKAVMKDGEHYGKIPGCGDKPTLLQPGAQKLIMTFRLVPDADVTVMELHHPSVFGHREYRVKVRMSTQHGVFLGSGVGSCNTMEKKYRFRTGPSQLTENPVPKEYWDARKEDPAKAQKLIGGPGHVAKKNEQSQWVIAVQGEPVEHDNPADYYNTCEKMAYKRALVSATLTVTAASDIFTQDIEEMVEGGLITLKPEAEKPPIQKPQEKKAAPEAGQHGDSCITTGISKITARTGKSPHRIFDGAGTAYNTFHDTVKETAEEAQAAGLKVKITFKKSHYGLDIETIEKVEPAPEPGSNG